MPRANDGYECKPAAKFVVLREGYLKCELRVQASSKVVVKGGGFALFRIIFVLRVMAE